MAIRTHPEIREVCIIKDEPHYVWPIDMLNGFSPRCSQCIYYKQYQKPGPHWDGECTSVAHNTERGYLHRAHGNDYTDQGNKCKWFFLEVDLPKQEEQPEQLRMEVDDE